MSHSLFARNLIGRWLEDLDRGDPVAIVVLCVFLAFLGVVGVVAFFAKRKMVREDAASKNKWKKK